VTLEVESGINDPVAVILTTALTENLLSPGSASGVRIVLEVLVQLMVGAAVGVGIGFLGRQLLARLSLPT
jgi:potassium/hydrogen antiporter